MEIIKQKFLMWTDIEIIITTPNPSLLRRGIIEVDLEKSFDIFSSMEKEFSRFDGNSILSKLNKNKTLEVSKDFIEVLKLSKEIYKKTNWYFNPLINISNIWYDKSFEKISPHSVSPKGREVTQYNLNFEKISWSTDGFSPLIKLEPNQNLDLWWIVKWYAVDKVKNFLGNKNYNYFIINAGWDIYVSKKSTIAIDSPKNNWDIFALVDLENCSISTSGTYKRKWKIEDKNYHHILNPLNNLNNNEIKSISLILEKCYLTDSYATACIAMWIEKSLDFLKTENIDWIIIWEDDKVYKVWDLEKYVFEMI